MKGIFGSAMGPQHLGAVGNVDVNVYVSPVASPASPAYAITQIGESVVLSFAELETIYKLAQLHQEVLAAVPREKKGRRRPGRRG